MVRARVFENRKQVTSSFSIEGENFTVRVVQDYLWPVGEFSKVKTKLIKSLLR